MSTASGASRRLGNSEVAPIRVLLVEDRSQWGALVGRTLARAAGGLFEVERVARLDTALARLEAQSFDAMLVDLSLPDAYGAFTIDSACAVADALPVLILSGTDDDSLAAAAVRAGAQDYLARGRIDRRELPGAVQRAVERHRRVARLHASGRRNSEAAGLHDPLTGLITEGLFRDRLAHSVARADRGAGALALLLIQVDHRDLLRELCGPHAGDRAMVAAGAEILRRVRKSDTAARFGEDGFGIIFEGVHAREDLEKAVRPLLEALVEIFAEDGEAATGQALSASIGISHFPTNGVDVTTLVRTAEIARREAALAGGNRFRFASDPEPCGPTGEGAAPPEAAAREGVESG